MALDDGKNAVGGFFKEFQDFIMKGNVIDLAVAVIIGGAFGKIVTSLIEDIITPVILNPALKAAKVDSIASLQVNGVKYGVFLAAVINFLVIALVIFLIIHSIESMKRKAARQEAIAASTAEEAKPDPQERLTLAVERLAEVMESK
ncbi:MAG: large conductance mechanosensitive channel protein MscL [Pseudanabaenaceae cyanobacterium bins.39]|nr:large conductance mechanosensitive channel protein MscL [Pseudanabaenaceae cyanobacterium bins.39]